MVLPNPCAPTHVNYIPGDHHIMLVLKIIVIAFAVTNGLFGFFYAFPSIEAYVSQKTGYHWTGFHTDPFYPFIGCILWLAFIGTVLNLFIKTKSEQKKS